MPFNTLLKLREAKDEKTATDLFKTLEKMAAGEEKNTPSSKGSISALTCLGIILSEGKTISGPSGEKVIVKKDEKLGWEKIEAGTSNRQCILGFVILGINLYKKNDHSRFITMMSYFARGFLREAALPLEENALQKYLAEAIDILKKLAQSNDKHIALAARIILFNRYREQNLPDAEQWLTHPEHHDAAIFAIVRALEGCQQSSSAQQAIVEIEKNKVDFEQLFSIFEYILHIRNLKLIDSTRQRNYFLVMEYLASQNKDRAVSLMAICNFSTSQLIFGTFWLQDCFYKQKEVNSLAFSMFANIVTLVDLPMNCPRPVDFLIHYQFLLWKIYSTGMSILIPKDLNKAQKYYEAIKNNSHSAAPEHHNYCLGEIAYAENRILDAMIFFKKAAGKLSLALLRLAECAYQIDPTQTEFSIKAGLAHKMAAEQKPIDTFTLTRSRDFLKKWRSEHSSLIAHNELIICLEREKELRQGDENQLAGYEYYCREAAQLIREEMPSSFENKETPIFETLSLKEIKAEEKNGKNSDETQCQDLYNKAKCHYDRGEFRDAFLALRDGVQAKHVPSLLLSLDLYELATNFTARIEFKPDIQNLSKTAAVTFKVLIARGRYVDALNVLLKLSKLTVLDRISGEVIRLIGEGLKHLKGKLKPEEQRSVLLLTRDIAERIDDPKQLQTLVEALNDFDVKKDISDLLVWVKILTVKKEFVELENIFKQILSQLIQKKPEMSFDKLPENIKECCVQLEDLAKQYKNFYLILFEFYKNFVCVESMDQLAHHSLRETKRSDDVTELAENTLNQLADKHDRAKRSFVSVCAEKTKTPDISQAYACALKATTYFKHLLEDKGWQSGYAIERAKILIEFDKKHRGSGDLPMALIPLIAVLEYAKFLDCKRRFESSKDVRAFNEIITIAEEGETVEGRGHALAYLAEAYCNKLAPLEEKGSNLIEEKGTNRGEIYYKRALEHLHPKAINFFGEKYRGRGILTDTKALFCSFLARCVGIENTVVSKYLTENPSHPHTKFYLKLLECAKGKSPESVFSLVVHPHFYVVSKEEQRVLEELKNDVFPVLELEFSKFKQESEPSAPEIRQSALGDPIEIVKAWRETTYPNESMVAREQPAGQYLAGLEEKRLSPDLSQQLPTAFPRLAWGQAQTLPAGLHLENADEKHQSPTSILQMLVNDHSQVNEPGYVPPQAQKQKSPSRHKRSSSDEMVCFKAPVTDERLRAKNSTSEISKKNFERQGSLENEPGGLVAVSSSKLKIA